MTKRLIITALLSVICAHAAPTGAQTPLLAKFDQLLDLADEAGLCVHPTGPDAWEGIPAWTKDLNVFSNDTNEPCLKALENYWRLFAARYRGRSTIWAYDLRNEPHLAWDTLYLRLQWAAWRKARNQDLVPVPDPKVNPSAPELADYQRFRESIAQKWVARQSKAIHAADPDALVTVGLLQWSVPAQRIAIDQYTGFRPSVGPGRKQTHRPVHRGRQGKGVGPHLSRLGRAVPGQSPGVRAPQSSRPAVGGMYG